jgi:hypothetical protein
LIETASIAVLDGYERVATLRREKSGGEQKDAYP